MSVRGLFTIVGRTFSVAGSSFYEILPNGGFNNLGTVSNDALPVSWAATPQQLLLASAGTAYVLDLTTNLLTAIPGATFSEGPVAQVAICDDFFLVTIKQTKVFYVSAPLNANDWTANGSAIVEVFPDNIVSMIVVNRQIWFFSDTKTVVYYDSGNIFPFDVNPNAYIDQGCAAEFSTALLNNTVFWLGSDERGHGVVYTSTGYTPQRISNHALEFAIQGYSRIDDCVALTYQDQGHSFYQLYFPTPSVTWTYDTATNMWHQRSYHIGVSGKEGAVRYWNHTFNFGRHLVGDWTTSKVYELHIPVANGAGWDFVTDDGNPIVRIRRAPHISNEQKNLFVSELQVYLESGVGPMPPLLGPRNPTYLFLADNTNQKWQIGCLDTGILTSQLASVPVQILYLNDATNTTSWRVVILTTGVLGTIPVALNTTYPKFFELVTATGMNVWQMRVNQFGILQTVFARNFYPARDPQVTFRQSKDGGHTWGNSLIRAFGQAGEFRKRVRWLRLGRARDRVIEMRCADAVPVRVVDAYIEQEQSNGV